MYCKRKWVYIVVSNSENKIKKEFEHLMQNHPAKDKPKHVMIESRFHIVYQCVTSMPSLSMSNFPTYPDILIDQSPLFFSIDIYKFPFLSACAPATFCSQPYNLQPNTQLMNFVTSHIRQLALEPGNRNAEN